MSNQNTPWGNNNQNNQPDLDQLFKKLSNIFKQGSSDGGNEDNQGPGKSFNFFPVLIIVALVFVGFQAFYQVEPGERGIVLQLGKYDRITYPGLNLRIPFIEEVTKVDVEKVYKEEFGFRGGSGDLDYRRSSSSYSKLDIESLMLTGDKNVIHLNWVVQYRISDPVKFLFQVNDPRAIVRDVSETVIRRLVGNRAFDYILDKREELAFLSKTEMQDLYDKYDLGIQLQTVQLQDVNPPDAVRGAFNEVNEADQDRRRLKNEAKKQYNERITKAEGEAKQIVAESLGYKSKRVNEALGEVSRFKSIYAEYKQAKQVTKTRMFHETMKEIIPKIDNVYVVDEKQKGLLPLLNLDMKSK